MALSFELSPAASNPSKFGPRLGQLTYKNAISLPTPNLIAPTSRGVVPHLSRDNLLRTRSLSWVHVPFESFLECRPPILTLGTPMHEVLGFKRDRHIVSMSLRDLGDTREMPPNTGKFVTAWCVRGVKKVTPEDWKQHVAKAEPDVVYALVDSQPVTSQKRLMKSVERTAEWLVHLLKPTAEPHKIPTILLQMPGNQSIPARSAFARTLIEPLHPTEIDSLKPLELSCLNDAVGGYVVDGPTELIRASLDLLSVTKPRIAHSSSLTSDAANQIRGPHDMLKLIRDVGIDIFGAEWAVKLAQWGVALDFEFPAPAAASSDTYSGLPPKARGNGKQDLGHNLYDVVYRTDFAPLVNSQSTVQCPCIACTPIGRAPETIIRHSVVDSEPETSGNHLSHTRAYIHHLLHTHEMSAHSLLVSHNLEIISAFLSGVRHVLSTPDFENEVERFFEYYDSGYTSSSEVQAVVEKVAEVVEAVVAEAEGVTAGGFEVGVETGGTTPPVTAAVRDVGIGIALYDEARACWAEVERLRGKGSLKREKQVEDTETTKSE
ncbi:hypothetical protein VNI00_010408 [Paramarasmius palmivorus]|uniref:tRNA-guanine(15) transglycosylase-like domain-containing protein n=1 Tax=Paramarasmius palmivorus TaxID=297713 RepID=A0AAW0CJL2_9AGAR